MIRCASFMQKEDCRICPAAQYRRNIFLPALQPVSIHRQSFFNSKSGFHRKTELLSAGLCFFDFKNTHGTCFRADSAGNTFAGIITAFLMHHQAEGTCLYARSAVLAFLLIDRVHALGVLRDSLLRTCLGTFAALYADRGLRGNPVFCGTDLDTGIILMEFLVKCL